MMGWIIALCILILIAFFPVGISARYDSGGPQIRIIAGPLRLQILPAKKKSGTKKDKVKKDKKEQAKPEAQKATKKKNDTAVSTAETSQGGNLLDFMPLVRTCLDFVGKFTRKLRVNRLELNLVLAGEDPCDLAINYGRVWTALGNLWPRLEETFIIKNRQVEIQCDFEAAQTLVTVALDITITLGRLLGLVVCYSIRALIQFIQITNKRKGGAQV